MTLDLLSTKEIGHETPQLARLTSMSGGNKSSALSRRKLLKTVVTGIGSTIYGVNSGSEDATGSVIRSIPSGCPSETPDVCKIRRFGQVLRVKATGSGTNEYRIESSDSIIPKRGFDGRQNQYCNSAVEGTLEHGHSDLYYFNGRIVNVFSRGSITYYVRE